MPNGYVLGDEPCSWCDTGPHALTNDLDRLSLCLDCRRTAERCASCLRYGPGRLTGSDNWITCQRTRPTPIPMSCGRLTCLDCTRYCNMCDEPCCDQCDSDDGTCTSCIERIEEAEAEAEAEADADSDDEADGRINSYGWKPAPQFHGRGAQLGVELEIDSRNPVYATTDITGLIDTWEQIVDADGTPILGGYPGAKCAMYLKSDCSLANGVEIVSHPGDLAWHTRTMPWADVMRDADSHGYRSHGTTTCGLHVHVDRRALGHTYAEQEITLSKLLILQHNHWAQWRTLSRRTDDALQRWARPNHAYLEGERITSTAGLDRAKSGGGRYVSINATPRETVEFRLFRGTLKHSTFVATLQFVNLMVDLCRSHGIAAIARMHWFQVVMKASIYPELTAYIASHGLNIVNGGGN